MSWSLEGHLRRSLERQASVLTGTIILNPVDSVPIFMNHERLTDYIQGCYVSDKLRPTNQQRESKILFGCRGRGILDSVHIYREWAHRLCAKHASLRLLSGLHAHAAVFMGLGKIGDKVLLLPEEAGGHFSTEAILLRLGYRVVNLPIDYCRRAIDNDAARDLLERESPFCIFIDRSEGLNYEDLTGLLKDSSVYSVFDASHYLPAILSGHYKHPFEMGVNLLITSLHKSFPGPQKALVATRRNDDAWIRVLAGLGTFVSSTHIKDTYLAGLALGKTRLLEEYAKAAIGNAVSLEHALISRSVPAIARDYSRPATTHLWIRADSREVAFDWYRQLERVRISANYRLLPYKLGYGLRLGTGAATLLGLQPGNIPELADIISAVLTHGASRKLRHQVRGLAGEMRRSAMVPQWPL